MLAAKDSKPVTSGERETTTTEREKSSTTSTPQPSGLGELAATATAPTGRGQGAVQQVQVGSASGADKSETSREGANRKLSPTPATRPMKYALEIWVELEVSPGVYGAPEDDSYGVDFVVETLNQAYPGVRAYTWMWPAIWWPSMGRRAIPRWASCRNKVFKLVRPSPRSPLGWDTPPPGGCGVSVLLRLAKLSQPAKGWKGRTGGELIGSFSTGSLQCD